MKLRVLIADSHALVSAGFRVLLESEDDIVVVAEAGSADETLELAAGTQPDVVLMDLSPGFADVDTTRRLLADPALRDVRVLMLGIAPSDEDVIAALRAGADGVLLKNSAAAEFVRAVRTVAARARAAAINHTSGSAHQLSPGVRLEPSSIA